MNKAFSLPYLSAIEEKFPRIAEQITLLWGHPEMEKFFEKLMYDDRGGREGFPEDVMSELVFLGFIHARAYSTQQTKTRYANRGNAFDLDFPFQ
jgi:hypothetical protein